MKPINEIKKELYKNKTMAKFSHYVSGNLYYKVGLEDGVYHFPIATVERDYILPQDDGDEEIIMVLSDDLGTTTFSAEIRASELNRWIAKAIESETFVKI